MSPLPEADTNLKSLGHIDTHSLEISQPSGLSVGASGTVLWVVGNRPDHIYRLDAGGKIVDSLAYEGKDMEGIVFDGSDSTLWIVEEREREVIHVDLDGNVLQRVKLELEGKRNSGLEGIALDGEGNLFLLNEKKPGLLIALADDLSIRSRYELDFARDYSGLTYDYNHDAFWILSHEDRCLHLWSEERGLLGEYELPFDKIEGVAVDEYGDRLFVVSETEQTLHVYALEPPR